MGFQYAPLIELVAVKTVKEYYSPPIEEFEKIDNRITLEKRNAKKRLILHGSDDLFHTPSQTEKIYAILKERGVVSLWDTFFANGKKNPIKCLRLGARIWDLKKIGVEFVEPSPKVTLPSGKKVCMYVLKSSPVRRDAYANWIRGEALKQGY